MAEVTWEKSAESVQIAQRSALQRRRYGYLVLGLGLLAVVAFLLINGTATARYYMTVDELLADSSNVGKNVRVAGAVDGESIHFDPATQMLSFTVVNIPNDSASIKEAGGLGNILHQALLDPSAQRLEIRWENAEMPDLLQHEAQAIMTGQLDENGVFQANQVLLKCPTRYSDEAPAQAASAE